MRAIRRCKNGAVERLDIVNVRLGSTAVASLVSIFMKGSFRMFIECRPVRLVLVSLGSSRH
jgi:hypothetical protein